MSKKKACRFVKTDGKRKVECDVQLPAINPEYDTETVRQILWRKINDASDTLTKEKIADWHHKKLGYEGTLSMEVKELFRRMIEWAKAEVEADADA